VLGKPLVQHRGEPFDGDLGLAVEVGHLHQSVCTGVSAALSRYAEVWDLERFREVFLQKALNGALGGLPLPTVVVGPVVLKVDSDSGHIARESVVSPARIQDPLNLTVPLRSTLSRALDYSLAEASGREV